MPKLRKPYDKYDRLKVLLNGSMLAADMNMTTLAAVVYKDMKTGRLKVASELRNPGEIKLEDLLRYAHALGIPAEELRAAIPMK